MHFTYKEVIELYLCISKCISTYPISNRDDDIYVILKELYTKFQCILAQLKNNDCKIICLQENTYIPTIYDKLK